MSRSGVTAYTGPLAHTGATAGFFGVPPAARPTPPTVAAAPAPAGGVGAAAGGWATAADRDTAIATINNLRTRLGEVESKLRTLGLLT